jgi:WD40 repeat protein
MDAKTGQELRRWPQKPGRLPIGAYLRPDGSFLAVGLSEGAGFEVYDLRTGASVFTQASDVWNSSAVFNPDNRTLAWFDSKGVHCLETATWQSPRFVAVADKTAIQPTGGYYSRDGRLFGVICGVVFYVIDTDSWTVRATMRGHAQRIECASFDDTGERIVTGSIDRTVRVWNTRTGELLTTLLGHESPVMQTRFIPNTRPGDPDVISVDRSNRIRMWRQSDNGPVLTTASSHATSFTGQLDFSSDSSTLRTAGPGAVMTIDLLGKPRVRLINPIACYYQCVIPGKDLVATNPNARTLTLDSLTDQSRTWSLDDEPLREFTVSPNGLLIGAFRDNHQISIIRVADGVELGRTLPEPTHYYRPAFSPDGSTLATLANSGVLRLWDTGSGALKEQLAGEGDRGVGVCWSSDGAWLAYAHARQGVTVLDMRTRQPITTIESVGGTVWSIAISPDNTRMAVGSQDRITHIYQLPSGDELLQLRNHTGTVMVTAWSPDGRYLATSGYDRVVHVYDSNSDAAAAQRP